MIATVREIKKLQYVETTGAIMTIRTIIWKQAYGICRLEFPTGNYDRPYSPDLPDAIAYYLLDHLSTF